MLSCTAFGQSPQHLDDAADGWSTYRLLFT
jgi:hypothetical protein